MDKLAVAVLGGVIVGFIILVVQGAAYLIRQWRRRFSIGELAAPPSYVRIRRLGYGLLRSQVVGRLRDIAMAQRDFIAAQYEKDPMWHVGQVRLVPASLDQQVSSVKVTLAEALAAADATKGIFVKGESGSGRSSVAALTAVQWSATPLALRIDLSAYNPKEQLLDQSLSEWIRRRDLERGLALGKVALIIDGFEALQTDEARSAFDSSLWVIRRRYPDVHFAVLARPEDTPTRALLGSTEYAVSPLSPAEVRESIAGLEADAEELLGQMDERTVELCSSPLVLRMVLKAFSEDGVISADHISLHREFVYALIGDRDETRYVLPKVSYIAKMEVVAELAYACENRTATFDYPRAQQVIRPTMTEMVSQYLLPSTVDGVEILRQLVGDGILRHDGRVLRFVHYSVQEFLAAVALHRRLHRGEVTAEEVADLSTKPEWRNSIVFLSGLQADATDLVEQLRFKNRVLAAECIQTAWHVDPVFVDMCVVEALYEYKFGQMSFNYDLISALLAIADKCSPDIPQRIVDEMHYWRQKYPPQPYTELGGIDDRALLGLLAGDEGSPQVVNAVWTLGVRGQAGAVPHLERLLANRVDQLDLVSALALGKLHARRSSQVLLNTALDRTAPANLRSACFTSIGLIRATDCLPAIADFLRSGEELDGSVREDAAWSLNGLAGDLLGRSDVFQAMLIEQFSVGTKYARAMFAYLMGRFGVIAGLDTLLAYAADPAADPFLLEDVLFAIGELGDDRAIPAVRTLLGHQDSIVQARAIEAAGKLPGFPMDELRPFASSEEPSEIVRDSARGQIDGDASAPPATATAAAVLADVRRRR